MNEPIVGILIGILLSVIVRMVVFNEDNIPDETEVWYEDCISLKDDGKDIKKVITKTRDVHGNVYTKIDITNNKGVF